MPQVAEHDGKEDREGHDGEHGGVHLQEEGHRGIMQQETEEKSKEGKASMRCL